MLDKLQKAIGLSQVATGNLLGASAVSKPGSAGSKIGAITDQVAEMGVKYGTGGAAPTNEMFQKNNIASDAGIGQQQLKKAADPSMMGNPHYRRLHGFGGGAIG